MKRRCKICGNRFETNFLNVVWCSQECLSAYQKERNQKARQKMMNKPVKPIKVKTPIKSRSSSERAKLVRSLVTVFNAYIRKRDENLPCISCGTTQSAEWHAGHYKTAKAHPELRFHEFNVNKQCHHCNIALSGNIEGYRKGIIERYGEAVLKELDSFTPLDKLTLFELKELIKHYKSKDK